MNKRHGFVVFFVCMAGGFLISSMRSKVDLSNPIETIRNLFLVFWYNITVGIICGVAGLFGNEIYYFIKKNLINERCRDLFRVS